MEVVDDDDDVKRVTALDVDERLKLDWINVQKWIRCFCVVDFDLALGQTLRVCYPPDALSDQDQKVVAQLSFPDSNSTSVGDSVFVFRFRSNQIELKGKTTYFFGISFFRQKEDATNARGYFQKSIVLISTLPFIELFVQIMHVLGPLYFQFGDSCLEAGCRNVSEWPAPFAFKSDSGFMLRTSELPLMGSVFHFCLEKSIETPFVKLVIPDGRQAVELSRQKGASEFEMFARFDDLHYEFTGSYRFVNLYTAFRPMLGNLWCLWELVVTGEPVLILSQQCFDVSQAVLGLVSLIAPLPFHGEFRPFFTVFDPDFSHFERMYDHDSLPPVILGATNPFFLKRFDSFPHVLLLSPIPEEEMAVASDALLKGGIGSMFVRKKTEKDEVISKSFGKDDAFSLDKMKSVLKSQKTPLLASNKEILNRLLHRVRKPGVRESLFSEESIREMEDINARILKNHFLELTTRFLAPLESYFKPKWSTEATDALRFISKFKALGSSTKVPKVLSKYNPYTEYPKFPRFSEEKFLDKVSELGNEEILKYFHFKSNPKASLRVLYEGFFRGPHFPPWFTTRRDIAERKLSYQISTIICNIDISYLIESMDSSQLIEVGKGISTTLEKYLLAPASEMVEETIRCIKEHLDFVSNRLAT